MQVVAELTGRPAVIKEVVVRIGRIRQQLDEVGQLRDERVDARTTIEWMASPVALEIAPLDELPAGPADSADRTIIEIGLKAEAAEARTPQRSPDAFRRIRELIFHPAAERFVVQALPLSFGEHCEQRIHERFDGPLAKEVGAEAVDGADLRLFEVSERASEFGLQG